VEKAGLLANPHSPGILMSNPLMSLTLPNQAPNELNTLIKPSPKLPTRNDPCGNSHEHGAGIIPHGEFNGPWLANLLSSTPLVLKILIKPFPGPATSSCLAPSCLAYKTYSNPLMKTILNGANPAGIDGSENGKLTGDWSTNVLLYVSILAPKKSAMYKLELVIANPLYTVPLALLLMTVIALVGLTVGL